MKKTILLLVLLSLSISINVKANPITLPPVISEFYLVNDSTWFLELDFLSSYYSVTSLNGFKLVSSSSTSYIKRGISITNDSIIVLTQDSMQSPIHFNRSGDYIYLEDSLGYMYGQIFFGNITSSQLPAPLISQSIVYFADSCWDQYLGQPSVYYLLVLDNHPTIGYRAFKPSSATGTFTGMVYDNAHHPVPGICIGHSAYYNARSISCQCYFNNACTNSSGSFSIQEYSLNYDVQLFFNPSWVLMDSMINIEPDSLNYYEFTIDTLLYNGINNISQKNNYSLHVFPNPGSANFTFQITTPGIKNENCLVKIYNSTGELVNILPVTNFKDSSANVSWNGKGKYADLSAGMYTCALSINGKTVTSEKLIIEK